MSGRRVFSAGESGIYTALFIKPADMDKAWYSRYGYALDKKTARPHVTIKFRPYDFRPELCGTKAVIRCTGYGCDGFNEGLCAECRTDNRELQQLLDEIELPHITLSVANDSTAVMTAELDFEPIEPFEIEAVYGIFTDKSRIIIK